MDNTGQRRKDGLEITEIWGDLRGLVKDCPDKFRRVYLVTSMIAQATPTRLCCAKNARATSTSFLRLSHMGDTPISPLGNEKTSPKVFLRYVFKRPQVSSQILGSPDPNRETSQGRSQPKTFIFRLLFPS